MFKIYYTTHLPLDDEGCQPFCCEDQQNEAALEQETHPSPAALIEMGEIWT